MTDATRCPCGKFRPPCACERESDARARMTRLLRLELAWRNIWKGVKVREDAPIDPETEFMMGL